VVVPLTGDRQGAARLLDAVISVSRELRLREVMQRIVGHACELVDAGAGALGIVELGTVVYEGRTAIGFPPEPPFLEVPLRAQDEVLGTLYVTEKAGGGAFTDEDRENLGALAIMAGIAVENARMYERSRQRERWLQASNEITAALLDGTEAGDELRLITKRARAVADTAAAAIAVAHEETPSKLVFRAIDGMGAASSGLVGETIDVAGTASGIVFSTGRPLLIDDYGNAASGWQDTHNGGAPPLLRKLGAAAIVPLAAGDQILGVLLLIKLRGEQPFAEPDLELLQNFAAHAALALQSAKARADLRRLAVFEDRDRIARDMQDAVIRRLFEISLRLQGLSTLVDRSVRGRIATLVDDLDGTIREVRRTIFSLQDHVNPVGDTPATLLEALGRIVNQASEALGFEPRTSLDPTLNSVVPQPIRADLLATAREALSNVARHAKAGTVSVTVEAPGNELTLTVVDDGIGIPTSRARNSGLANLGKRAQRWGGSMTVEQGSAGGTRLTWTVPLVVG
jgi:signal transduction histidine kinase